MSTVRVLLFAGYREAVGTARLELAWQPGLTVGGLWEQLQQSYPDLAAWHPSAAVNTRWARVADAVAAEDEVAFLPPVSGG